MKLIINPDKEQQRTLLFRPYFDSSTLYASVSEILDNVKSNGDKALREYTLRFDKTEITQLQVTEKEFSEAEQEISEELKEAIEQAKKNISTFHASQKEDEKIIETTPGVHCWRKSVGIEKVGLYVPGGSAPLFSTVLMLAVPAEIAGCKEIILCSPPGKDGKIHPAILFAAKISGVKKVFKAGGAQAIAAMAFGTESIPAVYKIFGPGNQYVTAAKQLINSKGIAIDMPAGPSEVLVYADESCIPEFVAADLLSQAEHGEDSQVILVSDSQKVVDDVLAELNKQLAVLPRKELAKKALTNSLAVIFDKTKNEETIAFINNYAPEHLILAVNNADQVALQITNAGSVFIGNYTPEAAGDYASGTNHTLPTGGFARAYSGVSLDSFVKKITFQKLSESGIRKLGKTIVTMAEAEQLQAHANAVSIRINNK
ncbi:MAG: Histidinol dehydrogenase [Bacteroidia bacterium]|nr:Histidinol dehydrogenase [Bacteroidia bacterium]